MKRPNEQDINPGLCKIMRLNMPAEENEAIRAEINVQKGRLLGFDNPLTRIALWEKNANIMVLGMIGAGKTTFLNMLKERLYQFQPWQDPLSGLLEIRGVRMKSFDEAMNDVVAMNDDERRVVAGHYDDVDGIVFIVDATDRENMNEARMILHQYLADDSFHGPILIVGNKVDMPEVVSCHELIGRLDLFNIDRPVVKLFMCSNLGGRLDLFNIDPSSCGTIHVQQFR